MSVPPNMMSAGPAIPPPPMGAPMAPPPPGGMVPPAVAALPGVSQLAQAQTMQMMDHQRQMQMMQEEMQKQIMMLVASLPTSNPAGEAAVSTPMSPMMSGNNMDMGGAPATPAMPMPPAPPGMMSGAPGAY
ncbi:hypothetical protein UFOVP1158_26 [uncultured Caudovirales phage]|uniref:Uncharacterized protein n=1 Tax=uncultured Caudovirales phage TaxID=2100421 RepID=A0A6J5R3V6_9CAUD|nr:hypothetical protein UFOVP1158_26 [uncultured Caudovirales phage]